MHFILNIFRIKPIKIIKKCLSVLTKHENTKRACDICALLHPQIYNVADFGEGKKLNLKIWKLMHL